MLVGDDARLDGHREVARYAPGDYSWLDVDELAEVAEARTHHVHVDATRRQRRAWDELDYKKNASGTSRCRGMLRAGCDELGRKRCTRLLLLARDVARQLCEVRTYIRRWP